MANITNVRQGEFMRVAFSLLRDNPEGLEVRKILDHISQNVELTGFELGEYPSTPNKPRYEKIVRFASIPLVKAGWITKGKGKWYLTDDGLAAYQKYENPEHFFKEGARLYQKWKKSREKISEFAAEQLDEEDPSGSALTLEEAQEKAWTELRDYIKEIEPFEFQDLVADLLGAMEYQVDWVAPPGKDKGIDIIAFSDPLGVESPRIVVQVKHRIDNPTTVKEIREFLSVIGSDHVGIFVSSGGFTRDAKDAARNQERRLITLIDLEKLFDLWVEYYESLSQNAQHRLPIIPVYYLATV